MAERTDAAITPKTAQSAEPPTEATRTDDTDDAGDTAGADDTTGPGTGSTSTSGTGETVDTAGATRPAETDETAEPVATTESTDAVAAPGGRKKSAGRLRKWWARFLVLVMILAAVWIGSRIIGTQDARDASLDLGTVTLTAPSIPVETSLPGLVTAVDVRAGQRVVRGQRLGQIVVTTTNSEGETVDQAQPLVSPRAGVVVDDPMTVGSTLQPAVAFVELYDPADLRFEAEVPLGFLAQMRPGMRAELTAEGLEAEEIDAVVQRAVPQVGDEGQDEPRAGRLRLVLVPQDRSEVADMIPGLRFTGSVDTRTGPQDGKESVYVG
jgi:hypothetical protein